jgi:hypothetical protein
LFFWFYLFSKKSANFSIGKDSASESRTKLASVMPSAACLRDFNRKSKNKKNPEEQFVPRVGVCGSFSGSLTK